MSISKRLTRLGGIILVVVLAALTLTSLATAYSITDFEDIETRDISGLSVNGMAFEGDDWAGILDLQDILMVRYAGLDVQPERLSGLLALHRSGTGLPGA